MKALEKAALRVPSSIPVELQIAQEKQKAGPTNEGRPWSQLEEQELLQAFDTGATLTDLAERHRRKTGAIKSRLRRLGKDPRRRDVPSTPLEIVKEKPATSQHLLDKPANAGKRWTEEEDELAKAEFISGMTMPQIADKHQRSATSIYARLVSLGMATYPNFEETNINSNSKSANAGKGWESNEDQALLLDFQSGMTIPELAAKYERAAKSVYLHLLSLGAMEYPTFSGFKEEIGREADQSEKESS